MASSIRIAIHVMVKMDKQSKDGAGQDWPIIKQE